MGNLQCCTNDPTINESQSGFDLGVQSTNRQLDTPRSRSRSELKPSKMNTIPEKIEIFLRENPVRNIHNVSLQPKNGPSGKIEGPFELEDKSTYEGEIDNGLRSGYGRQVWKDGAFYEGFWKEDQTCGVGRQIFANGNIYEGEWFRGRPHGHGKYFDNENGSVYEGDWN